MKSLLIVLSVSSWLSTPLFAKDKVQFKTGEMSMLSYIEMVSEAMKIQINASTIEEKDSLRVVVTQGTPKSPEQAMNEFLVHLSLREYTLVYDSDLDFYQVLRMRDARDERIPLVTDAASLADNNLLVTHTIPLKYFPVEAMARALRSFAPANSRIIPEAPTNTLFITDASRAMLKYRDLVAKLDNPKAAENAEEFLKKRAQEETCDPPEQKPNQNLFIALFALVGLVMGFLARGYLIRRIEGGL